MLTFSQMLIRLIIALALGFFIGMERETVGKDAGIRTSMLITAGASIFAMISVVIPYLAGYADPAMRGTSIVQFDRILSNIVVGVGFLGAGIIIKTGEHVRGLTTAALIWTAAAIGTLVGIGLISFAVASAVLVSGMLYLTRKLGISERFNPKHKPEED